MVYNLVALLLPQAFVFVLMVLIITQSLCHYVAYGPWTLGPRTVGTLGPLEPGTLSDTTTRTLCKPFGHYES